jgi:hypothetical protein
MWCKLVPTVPHLYVWLLTAPRNDYIDVDLPDEDETDASVRAPTSLIPASGPVANKSHALPQTRKSMAGWDICSMMYLAGGLGMEQAIVDADAAMPYHKLFLTLTPKMNPMRAATWQWQ